MIMEYNVDSNVPVRAHMFSAVMAWAKLNYQFCRERNTIYTIIWGP